MADFEISKLEEADEACKVRTQRGLHVQNLFAVITGVTSLTDCLQLCTKNFNCLSVNYIPIIKQHGVICDDQVVCSTREGQCILSGSVIKDFQQLQPVDQSVYAELFCKYNGETPTFHETAQFHGTAPRQCGVIAFHHPPLFAPHSTSISKRIVGGSKAPPYSQPWLGLVVFKQDRTCAISLMSNVAFGGVFESWSLFGISAAHCFVNKDGVMHSKEFFGFLFGIYDVRYPSAHTVYRPAEDIIVHRDYDAVTQSNDLAIVKFREKIRFNDYVRPICLPGMTEASTVDNLDPPTGLACSICGYGKTGSIDSVEDTPIVANVPNCFTTKLLRLEQPAFRASKNLVAAFYVSQANLVRYKGTGPGDSGSTVSCLINNQYTIFGVVSGTSVSLLDKKMVLNIFVRIPFYMSWIKCVVEEGAKNDIQPISPDDNPEDCSSLLSCFKIC